MIYWAFLFSLPIIYLLIMIPKIIHQTWKDENLPESQKPHIDKVKSLNPDWEYRLWTDAQMLEFVESEFPDFLETYKNFPKNIMRADSFRYLIMYKIGGVYLDLDYEVLEPFDFGNAALVLPYNRQISNGDKYDGIGNCFFASEPYHPFWKKAIEAMKKGLPKNLVYQHKRSTLEEETTGPAFLSRVFHENSFENMVNPDRMVYHPPTPKTKSEQATIEANGISKGIHHCAGTWREAKGLKKILQKLKRR